MTKNIIITLLAIMSLSSMTYGYFQKVRADEQEALAIENMRIATEAKILAETSQKEALIQQQISVMHAQRAQEQAALALKALAEAK
jgi:hypothetical protein